MAKYLSNRQQNLKIGIVSYTENQTVLEVTGGTYISGSVGIGTTNPTSKLTVIGDISASTTLTVPSIVGTSLSITGISTIANLTITNVGTGATVGGIGVVTYYGDGSQLTGIGVSIASYAERAGIATDVIGGIASVSQLYVTGISTFNNIVGTSLSITGISTIANFIITNVGTGATVGGIGVTYYGDGSQLTNIVSGYASTAGIATYAERAGIATDVIGGIASVSQLYVSGISTFTSIVGTALSISGISTIANFRITNVGTGATVGGIGVTYYGDGSNLINVVASSGYATTAGIATYAERAGISTDVIGGIASVSQLYVSGVSTFNNIVGTSLSITGISTIGTVEISSGIITATTGSGDVVYYGDGSKLKFVTAESSAVAITTNTTNQSQFLTYVTETGSVSGLGVTTTGLVFNPSTNSLGIGTTTPTSKLTVQGDVLVSGILTAANIVGTSLSISGIATLGITSTTNLTSQQLNVSGIATLGVTSTTNLTSQQLNVSGITTLGVTSTTNLTSQQLLVTGITTLGITSTTNLTSQQLNVSGITTLGITSTTNLTSQQLNVSGITTLGVTSTTNLTSQQLNVSGVSTFAGITTVTGTTLFTKQLNVSGVSTFGGILELDAELRDINGSVGAAGSILTSTGAGVSWSSSTSSSASTSIENTTTDATHYVGFSPVSTGTLTTLNVTTNRLTFNPSSGTLSATVFTSLSDRTQKEDIRPIENAIEIVKQLTGVRYNWKDSTNQPSIGLIAQDVEEVIPEVVVEMADGLKSVSYGNIVAVLIEAIKEQQVRIEELEDRLNA